MELVDIAANIPTLGITAAILIWFMKESSKKDDRMMDIMRDFKDTVSDLTLTMEQLRNDINCKDERDNNRNNGGDRNE